jgi:hypothetical protein
MTTTKEDSDTGKSGFFAFILRELHRLGVRHAVIGGRAAIHYRLAEFTKDYDLSLAGGSEDALLATLGSLPEPVENVSYRLGLSAPLSSQWGANGWTSHFEIRGPLKGDEGRDRLDVFLSLPRVSRTLSEMVSQYHLHILAETKKTQREKDWGFVEAFGRKIMEEDNPSGFLHIFDAEYLRACMSRGVLPSQQIVSLRPSLKLLQKQDSKLDLALLVERTFWQKYDRERLNLFRRAGKEYFAQVRLAARDLTNEPLSVQHQRLITIAKQHLPEDPWVDSSVKAITDGIVCYLQKALAAEALEYIPNLDAICHDDGVYHPQDTYE